MSKRKNFSAAILNARYKHCGARCEWEEPETKIRCDVVLKPGEGKNWHGDHDIPDALGGQPTFDNCRCLCVYHHAIKTKNDVARIRQADRQASAVSGVRKPGKRKIPSREKEPAEPQRRATKPVEKLSGLPKRPMYEEAT